MALVRRLDHVILCARDLGSWASRIERVLALRPLRGLVGDEWGFNNAEFDVGDGFIGVVEPAGEDSQLHRFLARFPEGFYGMSVDVGNIREAGAFLQARRIPYRQATRNGQLSQLWLAPATTGGVLYQLTAPLPQNPGANPEYLGISRLMVLVDDLDRSLAFYRACFGLEPSRTVHDDRLGAIGAELPIPASNGAESIALVAPAGAGPAAAQLGERGPGLLQFTIDVRDLEVELRRLAQTGVGTTVGGTGRPPTLAWIDAADLWGVRVELRQTGAAPT